MTTEFERELLDWAESDDREEWETQIEAEYERSIEEHLTELEFNEHV